jgi:hypothetical protein
MTLDAELYISIIYLDRLAIRRKISSFVPNEFLPPNGNTQTRHVIRDSRAPERRTWLYTPGERRQIYPSSFRYIRRAQQKEAVNL